MDNVIEQIQRVAPHLVQEAYAQGLALFITGACIALAGILLGLKAIRITPEKYDDEGVIVFFAFVAFVILLVGIVMASCGGSQMIAPGLEVLDRVR